MSRIFCFRLSFWLSSLFWALPVLILAEDLAIASKTIHNAKQASIDDEIALTSASIKTQGQEIRLNGKPYPISLDRVATRNFHVVWALVILVRCSCWD